VRLHATQSAHVSLSLPQLVAYVYQLVDGEVKVDKARTLRALRCFSMAFCCICVKHYTRACVLTNSRAAQIEYVKADKTTAA
jgi:hypothetical protein